jgi:Right handed beta helix region
VNSCIYRSKFGSLCRARATKEGVFAAPVAALPHWRVARSKGLLLALVTLTGFGCSDGDPPGPTVSPGETTSASSSATVASTTNGGFTTSVPTHDQTSVVNTDDEASTLAQSNDGSTEPSTIDTGVDTASSSGQAPSSAEATPTSSDLPPEGTSTDAFGVNSGPTDDETKPAGEQTLELEENALFAAPNGDASAAGTLGEPTTIASAVGKVASGGTIYLRGGTYSLDSTIGLGKDGTNDATITLRAYPEDESRPKLDFSAMSEDSSNRGLALSGDYWHVYGIDVFNAGDNCMFVSGSHNIVENSTFSECADTGLQLGNGAADNLVINCDSFFNADSSLENADGFAAKLDVGSGNRFVGCRAWNNLDDGWDGYLRPADNVTTTYENCWAIDNGKLKDGSVGAGDGNGFKTGGSDDKDLSHNAIYKQCIASGNVTDGFDHNSNRGSVTLLNCAAHDNGSNINFGTSNIAASLTVKNTISIGDLGSLNATATDISDNSWQDGHAATGEDFSSIDRALLKSPRQADGSLPNIDYLKLVQGSDLRNAGGDVGLAFKGSAPDLGAFESAE